MRFCAILVLLALAALARPSAQGRVPLPTAGQPLTIAAGGRQVRVSLVAGGLVGPWAMAFLPGGSDMLVTEMAGRLRVIRNGVLVPEPAWQVPPPGGRDVLHGVAVHPDFAQNGLVYVAHAKPGERGLTTALTRGRLDGNRLVDVKEIFVADADWIRFTEDTIAVAKRTLRLAQTRNQDAVSEITGDLSDACAACHQAYRDVGRGRGAAPGAAGAGRCASRVR